MNILHICRLGTEGAGNAAYRHSEALERKGYNSKLLVLRGSPKEIVLGLSYRDKAKAFVSKVFNHVIGYSQLVWHYMFGNYGLWKLDIVKQADIVYIHWINDFLGYKDIDYLLKTKKKVVWFLHDMWPITGGCHYALTCNNYKNRCASCPQLHRMKGLGLLQQKKKIRRWSNHDNFIIASPSKWLADCAKESFIFKSAKIVVCPNVLDIDVFKPLDKEKCRNALGLKDGRRYLMISAVDANNIYKGFDYLCKAISQIKTDNVEFLVVGNVNLDSYPQDIRKKIKPLGFISDQKKIIGIYNCVEAYVTSSIAENFPNVVIEAMACGIPVVGFATGGIPEQISHKKNGYVAKYKDSTDLAKGIDWVLNCNEYPQLCINARNYVIENCSYINVLKNHHEILEK